MKKNDRQYLLYIYRLKNEFDISEKYVMGHKIPCGVTPTLGLGVFGDHVLQTHQRIQQCWQKESYLSPALCANRSIE